VVQGRAVALVVSLVELPVATAPPLDRSRVWTVGNSDGGQPRVTCHSPHLLYIWHCATGAHQPSIGLGVPDQDASQGWPSRWTGPVEINTNILPLDLTFVL